MRADIRIETCTEGFIDKTEFHQVHVTVHFTDTELAVIDRQRMGPWIVMDRTPRLKVLRRYKSEAEFKRDQGRYALQVEQLLGRIDTFDFDHLLAAMEYRTLLEEKLTLLQENIQEVVREISR